MLLQEARGKMLLFQITMTQNLRCGKVNLTRVKQLHCGENWQNVIKIKNGLEATIC